MTILPKRSTESRSSVRLVRPRPEAAAPPPARRTRPDEGPVRPRKREPSVPAPRIARSSSPPCGERNSEDVTVVPPPARRRKRALVPVSPPNVWAPPRRIAYNLRNRLVPDTSNRKPITQGNETKEELEHDLSCSFLEEPKHDKYWKAPECARVGLEQYNSRNQGDEYELVRAVNSNVFIFNGIWLHANFLAKRKGATSCVDLVPEYFFAELEFDGDDLLCASCTKLDSVVVDPKNSGYCEVCPKNIMHPADGYHGHWKPKRPSNRHAAGCI